MEQQKLGQRMLELVEPLGQHFMFEQLRGLDP